MARRILTIAPYSSLSPVTGGTRRIHFVNRGLAEAGWEVFQFSFAGMGKTGPFRSKLFEAAPRYREYRYINPAVVVANRALKEFGAPQVSPSYLPRLAYPSRVLRRELARADIVMLEHPHYYDVVKGRLRPGQRLVQDSHNIEYRLYDPAAGRIAAGATARLEANETELFRKADVSFTCTEEDRAFAIAHFDADPTKVAVAPNGTDARGQAVADPAQRAGARATLGLPADAPVAFFAGSRWGPNVEAAQHIVAMAAAAPGTMFVIAGSAGAALGGVPANVRVTGFVDDLGPWLAASDVALNPMTSGGGSNIKMFDYLAAGLPVISTAFGARGVDDREGLAISVTELEHFPDLIVRLAQEPERSIRSEAARQLACERYDWGAIAGAMSARLEALLR